MVDLLAVGSAVFRTKLITDKPSILNSISNLGLSPLQFIIGQKIFVFRQDRLYSIEVPHSSYGTLFKTILCTAAALLIRKSGYSRQALKIMALFIAVTLTVGVIARAASLLQPEIKKVFATIPNIDPAKSFFRERILKNAAFFKELKIKLENEPLHTIIQWLNEQKKKEYSYPFYTAKYLEPKLTTLPEEAQNTLANYPDYFKFYYACTKKMQDAAFNPFFEEKEPENNNSLNKTLEVLEMIDSSSDYTDINSKIV